MKNYFFLFFLSSISIIAMDLHPKKVFTSMGYVNDFVVEQNRLYAVNNEGLVDIFDTKTQKIIQQIALPLLQTARGKLIPANILSIDKFKQNLLLVSVGKNNYKNVWIYKDHKLQQIINEEKKLSIKEARFVNEEQIIFGTFGSEIILHDTSEKYNLYRAHQSFSSLGDITLSKDKTKLLMSDESGTVKLIDTKSSKIEKTFNSQNVDNIYRIAYNNGVILTAGQDRRVGVYQKEKEAYHIKSDFLVYCVGLSPSGSRGIYSADEENNLQVFNTKTKQLGDKLVGHKSLINQIKFVSEKKLYSVGSRHKILYWELN